MLLFELVARHTSELDVLPEAELVSATSELCQEMNWQYDIDPLNERVFEHGQKMLTKIEEHLVALFSRNKAAAMNLWESHCPFAVPGIVPRFVHGHA